VTHLDHIGRRGLIDTRSGPAVSMITTFAALLKVLDALVTKNQTPRPHRRRQLN
jgi:hypothetical protein